MHSQGCLAVSHFHDVCSFMGCYFKSGFYFESHTFLFGFVFMPMCIYIFIPMVPAILFN